MDDRDIITQNIQSGSAVKLLKLLTDVTKAELAAEECIKKGKHELLEKVIPLCFNLRGLTMIALRQRDFNAADIIRSHAKTIKEDFPVMYGKILSEAIREKMPDDVLIWIIRRQANLVPVLIDVAIADDNRLLNFLLKQAVIITGDSDLQHALASEALVLLNLTRVNLGAIQLLINNGATIERALASLLSNYISESNIPETSAVIHFLITRGRIVDPDRMIKVLADVIPLLEHSDSQIAQSAEQVFQFILDNHVPLNGIMKFKAGTTKVIYQYVPLRIALKLGATGAAGPGTLTIKRLIAAGADPNAWEGVIVTDAVRMKKVQYVKVLLQCGADPRFVLNYPQCPKEIRAIAETFGNATPTLEISGAELVQRLVTDLKTIDNVDVSISTLTDALELTKQIQRKLNRQLRTKQEPVENEIQV
jgi:hypothetical protein